MAEATADLKNSIVGGEAGDPRKNAMRCDAM
jgi:hypothetical protein